MHCPYCLHTETKVTDKRDAEGVTRRRRECLKCARRFSTRESIERAELRVIKKDGRREPFDIEKIKRGITKACEKRPISADAIEKVVDEIEGELRKNGQSEILSKTVGEIVTKKLKKLDKIAYIRFASVYRQFADISDFEKELAKLSKRFNK